MKNKINKRLSFVYIAVFVISCKPNRADISQIVEKGLDVATEQALIMAKSLEDKKGLLPRNFENNQLKTANYRSWISGFYPGVLWYLYEDSANEELVKYANLYTQRVENAKFITNNHDLGFMLYCSYGNGYRLTKNTQYLEVLKIGAKSLVTRYNKNLKVIKSWESNKKWQYPVIIDNMMNLEFLCAVGKQENNDFYMQIANNHAQTTLKNHFRKDYSSYHVVSYDTLTGVPHTKNTHQGYADNSAWARGQGWALYGYTMMYRETGKLEYLTQAKQVASFIIKHPNMPKDKVPYWDFNAPDIPNATRDASAAAIMASALIELSQLDKSTEASIYLKFAKDQIRALTSPKYLAEIGTNGGFILKHSTGNHNKNSEVDVPLTYADYYYVEALLRLKKINNEK